MAPNKRKKGPTHIVTDPLRLAGVGLKRSQRRLRRLVTRSSGKAGLPPGTVVYTGAERLEPVRVVAYAFGEAGVRTVEIEEASQLRELRQSSRKLWVNVDGVHDVDMLTALGDEFGIHPLVLEDIARTGQRPKAEEYEGYTFLVVKMLSWDDAAQRVDFEQVSMVLGPNFLLSFQEKPGDVFDPVRERIQTNQTRIRDSGIDYLMYRLFDIVVDHYFVVLERLGDQVEELEDVLIREASIETLSTIHALKQETLLLRKAVWPLRELLTQLERSETGLIQRDTKLFIRDVYDHAIEVIDTVETIRDLIAGMLDVHLTNVSNRMNEVMKVLTIISTIFVPLTFIVGVYGMNFRYMPELTERWAYPAVWLVMLVVTIAMLFFFRRKRWI